MKRARAFYEDTLGFEAEEETNGGVVYKFAGGTGCFLYPTPNAGTSAASQGFWDVEDVEKVVDELTGRGVTMEIYPGADARGIMTAGGAKAWFKDSEGNIMVVIQNLENHDITTSYMTSKTTK